MGETDQVVGSDSRRVIATGAVMFPIAMSSGTIAERVLHGDDIAGISDLIRPLSRCRHRIDRRPRYKNGQGVLGAHGGLHPETGVLDGNFSLNPQGDFVSSPAARSIRAARRTGGRCRSRELFPTPIDADFRVTYAPRMVVAPAGGSSRSIEIRVSPKD